MEQIRGRSFNYGSSPAERQIRGRELLCPNTERSICPELLPRLSVHPAPKNQSGATWVSENEQETQLGLSPGALADFSF